MEEVAEVVSVDGAEGAADVDEVVMDDDGDTLNSSAVAADAATPPSPPTMEVDNEEMDKMLARANEFKEQGNEFLKAGKYIPAVEKYSAALEIHQTAVFYGNRAMAYLKLENYGLAIADAEEAMKLDKTYLKAYYRRASAHMALGKYKLALKDFKYVCKLKNDSEAKAQLKACEKAVKEEAFRLAIESEEEVPLAERLDPATISVEATYDGPRLPDDGTVTMEFVTQLLSYLKEEKILHKKYMVMILLQSYSLSKTTSSLMRLRIPEKSGEDGSADSDGGGHFTVCGDTHGQFYDVLNIFDINGLPSETNPYIFNGDYVDRGSFSVEVITSLLAIKLACPTGLFLTRGNHESKNMNKMYGFEGEVKHKYDQTVMTLFTQVFNWLPLAATINDKVFITHGGLPSTDSVTLKEIADVPRNREPPDTGLMCDLMWSDPQPFPGRSPSKRGVGMAFGEDVTTAFLATNNLELLVRSHEVKEEGYLVEHSGKCITVFSAPNYCDQMGNKGAFIKFRADLKPNFTQFEAVSHPAIRPMAYSAGFRPFGL